ncbi:hypothetical protein SEA_NOSHOW_70 [Mycobacterium phage NoShow]|nr:hypothetical protein SEA_NOSHOW_70 [Mycobacterium phage NoShow]
MQMPLPKEAKDALAKTGDMADDIKAIRTSLERLVQIEEEKRAAQE